MLHASAVVGYSIFQTVVNISYYFERRSHFAAILLARYSQFLNINNNNTNVLNDLKPALLSSLDSYSSLQQLSWLSEHCKVVKSSFF